MPQNHAQKEDDFLKMADDSILLRRRTLYPAELRKLVWIFQHFQRIWRLVTVQLGGERSILLSYGDLSRNAVFSRFFDPSGPADLFSFLLIGIPILP